METFGMYADGKGRNRLLTEHIIVIAICPNNATFHDQLSF